jgi:CheY-like chemotaxis protein
MAKILVVDDEADLEVLIKQKFRQKIREHKYEFLFAINGKHALEQLEQNDDVDVVLSDINMPEWMDLPCFTRSMNKIVFSKPLLFLLMGIWKISGQQ